MTPEETRQVERPARLGLQGWHGVSWTHIVVVGETPKRYRIRGIGNGIVPLAGRMRSLQPGQTALVPKRSVRFEND